PDLCQGRTVDEPAEAEAMLAEADMDATLDLVRSSLITLRSLPATPAAPLGFPGGAPGGLGPPSPPPELGAAPVVFYGTQSVDMSPAESAFLGHFAENDPYVDADELPLLEADLHDRESTR